MAPDPCPYCKLIEQHKYELKNLIELRDEARADRNAWAKRYHEARDKLVLVTRSRDDLMQEARDLEDEVDSLNEWARLRKQPLLTRLREWLHGSIGSREAGR